jgi:CheY-like chemotaxis protein
MIQEAASPQSEIQLQGVPIIYLVDDDPSFLRALSRRLRAADYRVETFGSAEEFLTRRRLDTAGCAVLDLQMPGPGGLELQEALAQARTTAGGLSHGSRQHLFLGARDEARRGIPYQTGSRG